MEEKTAPPTKQKYCQHCGEWKPLTEFYKRSEKSKYLSAYCKPCHTRPYKNERFNCPHCSGKIYLIGVDEQGNVVKKKNTLVTRLKKELRTTNKKKKKPVEKPIKDFLK